MAEYACEKCAHWLGGDQCMAFGRQPIPLEIRTGRNPHTKPLQGDHGMVFTPIKPDETPEIGRRAKEWLEDPTAERIKDDTNVEPDVQKLNTAAESVCSVVPGNGPNITSYRVQSGLPKKRKVEEDDAGEFDDETIRDLRRQVQDARDRGHDGLDELLDRLESLMATRRIRGMESLADDVRQAAGQTDTGASPADKQAGNYHKGVVDIQGLKVAIETPRLTYRQGVDKHGKPWQTLMLFDYGELTRSAGMDRDPIDVFLGPHLESQVVFIIDQIDQDTHLHDEHKAMIGFLSEPEAVAAYLENYDHGWKCGPVCVLTMDQFKRWLNGGWTLRPAEDIQDRITAAMESAADVDALKRAWEAYP